MQVLLVLVGSLLLYRALGALGLLVEFVVAIVVNIARGRNPKS